MVPLPSHEGCEPIDGEEGGTREGTQEMGGQSGAFFPPRFSTSLTTSQSNAHNNAPNNNENGHTTTRTAKCRPNDNPATKQQPSNQTTTQQPNNNPAGQTTTIGSNENQPSVLMIHRFPLSSTHPHQLTITPHLSKPACRMTQGCREPSADMWSTKPNTQPTPT